MRGAPKPKHGRLRPRVPKLNLLWRFSLVAIAPMVVLGFVLAQILQGQIERRSLTEARRSAALIGEAGRQAGDDPARLQARA